MKAQELNEGINFQNYNEFKTFSSKIMDDFTRCFDVKTSQNSTQAEVIEFLSPFEDCEESYDNTRQYTHFVHIKNMSQDKKTIYIHDGKLIQNDEGRFWIFKKFKLIDINDDDLNIEKESEWKIYNQSKRH